MLAQSFEVHRVRLVHDDDRHVDLARGPEIRVELRELPVECVLVRDRDPDREDAVHAVGVVHLGVDRELVREARGDAAAAQH